MRKNIILACIIIISAFLRLYNLENVPPSASLDEASIGFNAYSILETGRDEYNTKFPILLRAYDDFRPALYVYLVIPFVKLFGLNILAVRLPSVILSVLTVVATYFLTRELFRNSRLKLEIGNWKLEISETASLLLAISPWHIYISRLGHEVNAGLSFVVFAILFFVKAINDIKKRFLMTLSVAFFSLALYTYQSEKIFVPLFFLSLILVYRDKVLRIKKDLLMSLFLGIIFVIPIIFATLSPQGLIRFKGTSAFNNSSMYKESANNVLKYKNGGNILGQVINNRRLVPFKIFAINYLSHFNPQFIFSNSGNESFKAPNFGLLYIWEFPFLILGTIYLFKKQDKKNKLLLSSWVLIAFVAPSLTTDAPHAMRAFNTLPMPQILTALGVFGTLNFIKEKRFRNFTNLFYLCLTIIVIYFLANFYKEYFHSFPKNQSSSFQYSLHSAINFVLKNDKSYNRIIFSNKDNLYQSYMFYLFYSKYAPYLYRKQGGTKSGGFVESHVFDKYEFRPIVWSKDKYLKDALFIGNTQDFPNQKDFLNSFVNLDGKGEIKIVQN